MTPPEAPPGEVQPAREAAAVEAAMADAAEAALRAFDGAEAFRDAVRSFERALLDAALRRSRGRVAETAAALGVPERTLRRRMRARGARKEDHRPRRKRRAPEPP